MLEQSINLSQQKSLYLLTGGSKLPFNLAHNFGNVLTECILIHENLAVFEKAQSATPQQEVPSSELWHVGKNVRNPAESGGKPKEKQMHLRERERLFAFI